MKKSDLQWEFLKCLALLIIYAMKQGYKLTQGRAYASKEANEAVGGHPKSTHLHRLGQDLMLFVDDVWIQGDHEAWHDLGEHWKTLHPRACWGGDWGDYNHFSFSWNGIR